MAGWLCNIICMSIDKIGFVILYLLGRPGSTKQSVQATDSLLTILRSIVIHVKDTRIEWVKYWTNRVKATGNRRKNSAYSILLRSKNVKEGSAFIFQYLWELVI